MCIQVHVLTNLIISDRVILAGRTSILIVFCFFFACLHVDSNLNEFFLARVVFPQKQTDDEIAYKLEMSCDQVVAM